MLSTKNFYVLLATALLILCLLYPSSESYELTTNDQLLVLQRSLRTETGVLLEPHVNQLQENSFVLSNLESLGVAKYFVIKNNINNNKYGNHGSTEDEDNAKLPVVMVVHHREFFQGCHSFERFFSPKWETIFVLEEDFVDNFGLEELARNSDSPGVHFAILTPSVRSGEWLGKEVALRIMKGAPIAAPLLLSMECDSHPIPEFHKKHIPFDQVVTRMVTEFLREDELNRQGKTNVNDYNYLFDKGPLPEELCTEVFSPVDRPLLVMNTVLLETLPSAETFQDSLFHAIPVGLSRRWKDQYDRPSDIPSDKPWMSDISTFVEDHATLYNATLLSEITPHFLPAANTISTGVFAIPRVMCEKGFKAVRLNELALFYDYAKSQYASKTSSGKEISLYDPNKYGAVSLDWLQSKALTQLADISGHSGCLEEYMRLRVNGNSNIQKHCLIVAKHLQTNHVPERVWSNPVHANEDLVRILLKAWGFVHTKTTADNKMVFVSVETNPAPNNVQFLERLTGIKVPLKNAGQSEYTAVAAASINSFQLVTPREEKLEWKVLELDRNATLQSKIFFHENLENRARFNHAGFRGYSESARILCDWILSQHHRLEFDNDSSSSKTITSDDVLRVVEHFRPLCHVGYVW